MKNLYYLLLLPALFVAGASGEPDAVRPAPAPVVRRTIAQPVAVVAYGSPAQAVRDALADAKTLPLGVVENTRYLSLYNVPPELRAEFVLALRFWTNSLSRESAFSFPRRVCDDLYAVNVLDYGPVWRDVWERQADTDPYFHVQLVAEVERSEKRDGKPVKVKKTVTQSFLPFWLPVNESVQLGALTQSAAPVVRADWWLMQSSRQLSLNNDDKTGIGYYDWLGLKTVQDFERLCRIDSKASIEIGRDVRAVLTRSAIAIANRGIERDQALTGGHWKTLDSKSNVGRNNAVRNLGRGDFLHDAEERIGVLPCMLHVYFLNDFPGLLRQDSAPDFVGANDSPLHAGRDYRIHSASACVECHVEGLRGIDDWARRVLRSPLGFKSPDYNKLLELRRQYFSDLQDQLAEDNRLYCKALLRCNGLDPAANAAVFAKVLHWYSLRPRGPCEVAIELGVSEAELMAALRMEAANPPVTLTVRSFGRVVAEVRPLDTLLAGLLNTPPEPLRVEHLEEIFSVAQDVVTRHRNASWVARLVSGK